MSPLLAPLRHAGGHRKCPLIGIDRKWRDDPSPIGSPDTRSEPDRRDRVGCPVDLFGRSHALKIARAGRLRKLSALHGKVFRNSDFQKSIRFFADRILKRGGEEAPEGVTLARSPQLRLMAPYVSWLMHSSSSAPKINYVINELDRQASCQLVNRTRTMVGG